MRNFSDAIASSENVRIAPSLRSQKGAIWTRQPINFEWWEVDIAFRITGRGRIGADGLVSPIVFTKLFNFNFILLKRFSSLLITEFLLFAEPNECFFRYINVQDF